jgi:hypothetical protein
LTHSIPHSVPLGQVTPVPAAPPVASEPALPPLAPLPLPPPLPVVPELEPPVLEPLLEPPLPDIPPIASSVPTSSNKSSEAPPQPAAKRTPVPRRTPTHVRIERRVWVEREGEAKMPTNYLPLRLRQHLNDLGTGKRSVSRPRATPFETQDWIFAATPTRPETAELVNRGAIATPLRGALSDGVAFEATYTLDVK